MHKPQAQVHEFHQAMELTAPETYTMEGYPGELRVKLLEEETAEFAHAWKKGDRLEMIKELCDILYVAYGAAVSMGLDLEPFFDEVHASNMTKLGGPVREDGKRLKPAHYKPADMGRVLDTVLARRSEGGASVEGNGP